MDIWVVPSLGQSRIKLLLNVHRQSLCEHMFSFLLGGPPGVGLLRHMVHVCILSSNVSEF